MSKLMQVEQHLIEAMRLLSEVLNEQPTTPTQPEEPQLSMRPFKNFAEQYGVTVEQVSFGWTGSFVEHLSPEENKGRHGIYVAVMDEFGARVRDPNLRIGYTWEGRRNDEPVNYPPLDKPDGELGDGVVDMYPGQKITIWIEDPNNDSANVLNLHTNHPDEPGPQGELWNTLGHHSFRVVFVKR